MPGFPYEGATSGWAAMDEIRSMLIAFGCTKFAPLEDFDAGTVTIQFQHRGRIIQVTASAKGWAQAWLKKNPWSTRRKGDRTTHERKALAQGRIAVWSILRDWIKGQTMAVETGILSFEAAFLGQILLENGDTVMDRITRTGLLAIEDKRDEQ